MKGDKVNGRRKEREQFFENILILSRLFLRKCRLWSLSISFLAVWDRFDADRCVQLKLQCMKCTFIMETFGGCFFQSNFRDLL